MNSRQNKAGEDSEDADGSHWQENRQFISTDFGHHHGPTSRQDTENVSSYLGLQEIVCPPTQNSGSCAVTQQQFSQLISQQHQMNLQQQQMTLQLQQIMMQQQQLMQKQEEMMKEIEQIQLQLNCKLTMPLISGNSNSFLYFLDVKRALYF